MKKISQEITDALILHEYISSEKRESYVYCYTYIIENVKYDIFLLLTGLLLHRLGITFTFLLFFNIYRTFCGGYHAKEPIVCNILSYSISLLFFLASMAVDLIPILTFIIIFIASICIIVFLSPLDCATKTFTDAKRKISKKIVLLTCLANIIAYIFFAIKNQMLYCYAQAFCVMVVAVSLITQKIINMKRESL